MNPKLQYCLQEYKFAIYNNEEQTITNSIKNMQKLTPANLPVDKLDIFEEHFDNALGTFAIVKKLQKTEQEYELFAKDYKDLHFDVRKIQKKVRKIDQKIKKLKSEIRNLDEDNLSAKNKLELKIENYELEIKELQNKIPESWKTKNGEFEILHKAKNTRTKRYRKNVDEAYETLDQIVLFINDNKKLKKLSPEIKELKYTIDNKNFEKSISIIDNLFEKLGEISGTEEFANKLDDLISVIDNDEVDEQKLIETSLETFDLFNAEVTWRADANTNLLPELIKYNDVIKHNIGLRLQTRLTKEQAKFVARCNSVHRDISLNF